MTRSSNARPHVVDVLLHIVVTGYLAVAIYCYAREILRVLEVIQ